MLKVTFFCEAISETHYRYVGLERSRSSYVTVPPGILTRARESSLYIVGFTVSLLNLIPEAVLFIFYYCYLQSWKSTRET